MTTYQLRIVPENHVPGMLPVAEIFIACTAPGCDARYLMPEPPDRLARIPSAWLDANRPRWDDIRLYAARRGWTYTDEHGPRCGEHPYGKPVAELEAEGAAHRREQAITDTAEIDVDAVKAALAEGGDTDADA